MTFMNRKSGFTLAEVLVTLMIIGVIAAMTIPSLMQSTAQQEYKAAFKKAVSMINQAVTLNYALEGSDATNFIGTSFHSLMTQRLSVLKEIGAGTTAGGNAAGGASAGLYTADGMWFNATDGGTSPKDSRDNTVTTPSKVDDCNPNNGYGEGNVCATVVVDVNGEKGPNRYTDKTTNVFDMFVISVYPQKAIPGNETMQQIMYQK